MKRRRIKRLVGVHLDTWVNDGVIISLYRTRLWRKTGVAAVIQDSQRKHLVFFEVTEQEIACHPNYRAEFG